MNFKTQIKNDLENIFFNMNEFAETHKIDNKSINIIIDNDKLIERSKKEYDGISVGEILFYVKKEELGYRPEQSRPIVFDGRQMYVFDCREDNELYEIILQQNRGS